MKDSMYRENGHVEINVPLLELQARRHNTTVDDILDSILSHALTLNPNQLFDITYD